MPNPILESIAQDIQKVNELIEQANELISAARDAGEDVHEMEAEMRVLELRKLKWERMLSTRGL